MLERLCGHIASGDLTGSPPFDPTKLPQSNTLILVDIKGDKEAFLENFERLCAGRGRLTGHSQLACFYALMVFSIVKGLLIDAYSVRNTCDDVNPWDETCALRITSAFKTLVSVFNWSSKQDVMLQNQLDLVDFAAVPASRDMLKVEKWDERGFKSSRDFLLNLGSLVLPNDSYNGFFKQKFGLEKVPVYLPNIQSPANSPKRIAEGLRSNNRTPNLSFLSKKTKPFTVHKFSSATVIAAVEPDCPGSPDTLSPEPELSTTSDSDEAQSTFTFVGEDQDGESTLKRSVIGRRGGLNQEKLKKFRELRKIGACWNCWVMKVPVSIPIFFPRIMCQVNYRDSLEGLEPEFVNSSKPPRIVRLILLNYFVQSRERWSLTDIQCSEGHPCQRCNGKSKSNGTSPVCNRAPFSANVSLFFPGTKDSKI